MIIYSFTLCTSKKMMRERERREGETERERQRQREIVGRVVYLYTDLHNNVFDLYFH